MENDAIEIVFDTIWSEIKGIRIVNLMIFIGIIAFLVFVPGIILQKKGRITEKKLLYVFLLIVYVGLMFTITVFRRPYGTGYGIVVLKFYFGFGLRSGMPSIYASTITILNFILFVPLGILLYLLLGNKDIIRNLVFIPLIGTSLSLIIECTQLYAKRGMFEITDLFTNTIGSFIGALIGFLFLGNRNKRS